jgi:hypothetical protein
MTAGDAYAQWDAAYVLGALSASQRQEFEEHLATCRTCSRAVAELAGMPGLLAQVPVGEVLAMDARGEAPTPPRSLMPVLPDERRFPSARGWSRLRRYAVPAVAAAALLVGGAGGYGLRTALTEEPSAVASAPGRLAFSAVVPSSMTAVVDVVPSGEGTVFKVECQYGKSTATSPGGVGDAWAEYAIFVVDRSGQAEQAKTWKANPDRVMRPTASSPLPVSQISAVEIRAVESGTTLMRARVS